MKLEKVSEHNQTIKSAKELLQGNPRNCILDTLENINDVYKALVEAFGDPTNLLNYKKKSLSKLSAFPSYDIKGGHKLVVDWYLNLETQLQCLLDLEQTNSKDEDLSAMDLIRTMANMFGKQVSETVLAAAKDQQGRVRLQALKDKISEWRISAQ